MKKSVLSLVVIAVLCGIMYSEMGITNSNIPPKSKTGAPSEGNCGSCHSGNINTGPGDATFSLDGYSYIPDSTYNITVEVTDGSKTRFGFQITALDGNNDGVGSLLVTNTTTTSAQTNLTRQYINQKTSNSNGTWLFNWTAPDSNIGPVSFYLCGNATNNNSATSGDNVYTRVFVVDQCGLSMTDSIHGSYSDTSGAIYLTVLNGTQPYTYAWSNGDTIEDLTDLLNGAYTVTVTDASNCTSTMTINVPIWISVDELKVEETFEIYPNPSSGIINFRSLMLNGDARISVFNLQGAKVYETINVIHSETYSLDLSDFSSGIYTVVISEGEQYQVKKIVIH